MLKFDIITHKLQTLQHFFNNITQKEKYIYAKFRFINEYYDVVIKLKFTKRFSLEICDSSIMALFLSENLVSRNGLRTSCVEFY